MFDLRVTNPTQTDADADFVFGKARNIVTQGDNTGTPWNAFIINNTIFGPLSAILDAADISPNGTEEKAGQSQVLDALRQLVQDYVWGDRFVGKFEDGFTYTTEGQVGRGQDQKYYKYIGTVSLPVTIPSGTDPQTDTNNYKQVKYESIIYLNENEARKRIDLPTGTFVKIVDKYNAPFKVTPAGLTVNDKSVLGMEDGRTLSLNLDGVDEVNFRWLGGSPDLSNNSSILQFAIDYCIEYQRVLYIPAGEYILGDTEDYSEKTTIFINFYEENQSFYMRGDGKGLTILKAEDGKVLRNGRFDKMFYLYLNSSQPSLINTIKISDITLDKNGLSNGNPPTEYGWEQAHIFGAAFEAGNSTRVKHFSFEDVEIADKVGAGISISSAPNTAVEWDLVSFKGITEDKWSGIFGQRGDIESSVYSKLNIIDGCNLLYIQIEAMENYQSTKNQQRVTKLSNSTIDVVEYTADGESSSKYTEIQTDCLTSLEKVTVRGVIARIVNSTIKVNEFVSGSDVIIDNSTVLLHYDSVNNEVLPLYPRDDSSNPDEFRSTFILKNSRILLDSEDDNIQAQGYAIANGAKVGSLGSVMIKIDNVEFDPRIEYCYDAYANGRHRLTNNQFRCWGDYAVAAGSFSVYVSDLYLEGNDWSEVPDAQLRITQSNNSWKVKWNEKIQADSYKVLTSASSGLEGYEMKPLLLGSSTPSGNGVYHVGLMMQYDDPVSQGYVFSINQNYSSSPVWKNAASVAP